MSTIALVTGASSGFGRMIAEDLARSGLIVYASMRGTAGKNAGTVADIAAWAARSRTDLRTIELDVREQLSVDAAIERIIAEHGRLDVLVHNAGHMVLGPLEAFSAEELAALYDVNVLGTQRVNRAVLPHMRAARDGLLVWISSSSVMGGIPPLLGPYFAAKAGMDQVAVSYARELAPFGIETTIVVPGAFTSGTNHFANAGTPADQARAEDYTAGWPSDFADKMVRALAATVPPEADPAEIGRAVAEIVRMPKGKRPYRVVIDPASDGAVVGYAVVDRLREQFLDRIGFPELRRPTALTA
ncbi:SDR family oxidoreductase [Methylobacterium sp. C25]|uniref:SDR family oxidoreductase n=1 Tax=Methylobacterium sp. C25 TaxID=2721622 RepID=UPI001F39CA0E|nr:SDR family oxidoreductase [Methylobacterium sp. C25]MCE4225308.1 SDR family oxidoreductase [Methylobacterium sp. C25]